MKISVVIPTYNRYRLLKRALSSVFIQTYQPSEIIIIDDGSTDGSYRIKEDFPSIIYYFKKNMGVSSARNKGIALSRYEWIAFLDSDDEWDKEKLALHVKLHQQKPLLRFSYTDEMWICNQNRANIPKKFQKYEGQIFNQCLSHCIIAPSSVLIHKSIFNDIGLFDKNLAVCEDYDLWLRLTCKYEVGLIKKPVTIKHGGHGDQLSYKYWGMDRFRVQALEKLLALHVREIEVKKMLIKKYTLLINGAKKHNKEKDVKQYESRLLKINVRYDRVHLKKKGLI